jgi:hypothetical protein
MNITAVNSIYFGRFKLPSSDKSQNNKLEPIYSNNVKAENLSNPESNQETLDSRKKLIKDYERKIFELQESLRYARNETEHRKIWISIIECQEEIRKLKQL